MLNAIAIAVALIAWCPVAPESSLSFEVRPTDLDSKGHVNNARHLEYLQWGRWRWMEDRGISDESLRSDGAAMVVVRVEINYRAEIRYGDRLTVRTQARADGEKKVVYLQEIRRPDGSLAAEATVIMVAIDPAVRRSRPIPNQLRKALETTPR